MKEFFLSHTTCRKYFLATGRNFLALQVINCHRKKFIVTESIFYQGQKFLVTRRNFLLQGRISCQRQKCPVTGRNFLSQKKTSCQRNKFHAIIFNYHVKGRNTQITAILDVFCRVLLPLFRAKFLAESIGSHEVKYFIPPWKELTLT